MIKLPTRIKRAGLYDALFIAGICGLLYIAHLINSAPTRHTRDLYDLNLKPVGQVSYKGGDLQLHLPHFIVQERDMLIFTDSATNKEVAVYASQDGEVFFAATKYSACLQFDYGFNGPAPRMYFVYDSLTALPDNADDFLDKKYDALINATRKAFVTAKATTDEK